MLSQKISEYFRQFPKICLQKNKTKLFRENFKTNFECKNLHKNKKCLQNLYFYIRLYLQKIKKKEMFIYNF